MSGLFEGEPEGVAPLNVGAFDGDDVVSIGLGGAAGEVRVESGLPVDGNVAQSEREGCRQGEGGAGGGECGDLDVIGRSGAVVGDGQRGEDRAGSLEACAGVSCDELRFGLVAAGDGHEAESERYSVEKQCS